MKYLLIIPFLFACSPISSGPKYLYKQLVKYNPPKFYTLACSGLGIIDDYKEENNKYRVSPASTSDNNYHDLYCPDSWISEDNIMPEGK